MEGFVVNDYCKYINCNELNKPKVHKDIICNKCDANKFYNWLENNKYKIIKLCEEIAT